MCTNIEKNISDTKTYASKLESQHQTLAFFFSSKGLKIKSKNLNIVFFALKQRVELSSWKEEVYLHDSQMRLGPISQNICSL